MAMALAIAMALAEGDMNLKEQGNKHV